MSNIDELQHRAMAAMERVAHGLTQLHAAPANTAGTQSALAAAERALADEKSVTAELNERVHALTERIQAAEAAAVAPSPLKEAAPEPASDAATFAANEALAARLTSLDADLQRLRQANAQLLASNAALRTANAEGVRDAHLINKSMMAELEGLRAMRAAESAEARTIIDALTQLLEADAMQTGGTQAQDAQGEAD